MFLHLICLLVLLQAGGLLGAEVGSSIVGGRDAVQGAWPWMVHINITHNRTYTWRCGGTILTDDWVLTAAHCFDPRLSVTVRDSFVAVGTHELRKGSAGYKEIFTVILHPQYKALSDGYENDLALVKLKKKLHFTNNVSAIRLPDAGDTFGPTSDCWITGWGQVGNGVPLPNPETLQELKIPLVPESICKKTYPSLKPEMLCAGAADKDACEGDYGGPLVCETPSGYVQVGIMSSGSPAGCGRGQPGIYTRVSSYLDLIKRRIHS